MHWLFFELTILVIGASTEEFKKLNVNQLIILCLLYWFSDHVHLTHTETIDDPDLITNNMRLPQHQIDAIALRHPLLTWVHERLENLSDLVLIGEQDLVIIICPPYVVSELLPFGEVSALEGVRI